MNTIVKDEVGDLNSDGFPDMLVYVQSAGESMRQLVVGKIVEYKSIAGNLL